MYIYWVRYVNNKSKSLRAIAYWWYLNYTIRREHIKMPMWKKLNDIRDIHNLAYSYLWKYATRYARKILEEVSQAQVHQLVWLVYTWALRRYRS